jgi:hypothetical protein
VLDLIGQLYGVERACPGPEIGTSEDLRAGALAFRAARRVTVR